LLSGATVDLIVTDPPYNVDYEGYTEQRLKIQGDRMSHEQFQPFLADSFDSYRRTVKPGASAYICHSSCLATGIPERTRAGRFSDPLPDHLGEDYLRLGLRQGQVPA
jgi:DNA modification methylase